MIRERIARYHTVPPGRYEVLVPVIVHLAHTSPHERPLVVGRGTRITVEAPLTGIAAQEERE